MMKASVRNGMAGSIRVMWKECQLLRESAANSVDRVVNLFFRFCSCVAHSLVSHFPYHPVCVFVVTLISLRLPG